MYILHFHNVVIHEHDLATLDANQWLNDTIIEFHVEYLEFTLMPQNCNILLLRPGIVQLITHIQDDVHLGSALPPKLPEYGAIFIPVNDSNPLTAYSGSHWSLLVFMKATHTFYYYDSLGKTNEEAARLTARRLAPLLRLDKEPGFVFIKAPQQGNGADCGAYVILITDFLVKRMLATGVATVDANKLMSVSKEDLGSAQQVRKELRDLILQLSQEQISP